MENKIRSLTRWLDESGQFKIASGISVAESDEAGRGVVLVDGLLKKNEMIVSVPSTHQLNFHTVLYHISKFNAAICIPMITITHQDNEKVEAEDPRYKAYNVLTQNSLLNLSSFQLLSLYVLAEWFLLPFWSEGRINSFWEPFFAVWPTQEELKSFPAIWNCSNRSGYKPLLQLLPSASKGYMLNVSKRIKNDWKVLFPIVSEWHTLFGGNTYVPSIDEQFEAYLHIYSIINSRCLYTEVSLKQDDAASNFTMVPFVDFLNHTQEVDVHCYPQRDALRRGSHGLGQFTIRCGNHAYKVPHEEIFLNYGAHSNDFLINEYGFVIKQNKWNFIDISKEVCSIVKDRAMQKFLKDHGYWEDYTVGPTRISYRVIVALSLAITGDYKRVQKLLLGYLSEDYFFPKIKDSLYNILTCLRKEFDQIIPLLEERTDVCSKNLLVIYQDYIEIIEQNLTRIRK